MISITPVALEKLTGYLAENKVEPRVRVYLPSGGCCGGDQLSLTLDEPDDDDVKIQAGTLELFMEQQLFDIVGKVIVDFQDDGHDSGFVVTSENPVPTQDIDCGGACAGCGC